MTKKVTSTKIGFLECKMCKNYKMSVVIPFDKSVMDKFDAHIVDCSSNPANFKKVVPSLDNVNLGYN